SPGYTSGLTATFLIADGPLQPGSYRFTAGMGLSNRFGTALIAPFVRSFSVASVAGYTYENRSNNTAATATPLPLIEDPSGSPFRSAAGRGVLSNSSDVDYFSFAGTAGDKMILSVDTIFGGNSYNRLYFTVYRPDGTQLAQYSNAYNSNRGQF